MSEKHYSANGFDYTVTDNRSITASGNVPSSGEKCGTRVTPPGMEAGDHRGHIIAASHNGVNAQYNMTAQVGDLNQGAYRTVERTETDLARQGCDVHTEKTAYVSTPSGKPDAYMVNDTITAPDGTTQHVNLSFSNLSQAEQTEMNDYIDNNVDMTEGIANPDPLRESMTTEEYSQLMEETDAQLPTIEEEYDMTNTVEISFDDDYVAEAQAELDSNVADVNDTVSVDNDVSADVDGGADMSDGIDV